MTTSIILFYSCKKDVPINENHIPSNSHNNTHVGARSYLAPQYYQLQVDPGSGNSFLNLITETCASGTVTVTPITGAHGDNKIGSSYLPPTYLTGLSFDETSGKFYATNGTDQLVKFYLSDINDASYAPITVTNSTGDTYLELYDIERDPTSGFYYAINRHPNAPYTCRIVVINNSYVAHYLPFSLSTFYAGSPCTGLCFFKNGVLLIDRSSNKFELVNKTNGTDIFGCAGGFGTGSVDPECGLHGDPITNNVVMANQKTGVGTSVINFMSFDGYPVSCPPSYCEHLFPSSLGLKPKNTVDFSSTVNDDW